MTSEPRHRRSRLDPHRELLVAWALEGRTLRAMSRELRRQGLKVTHQAISNYVRVALAPSPQNGITWATLNAP